MSRYILVMNVNRFLLVRIAGIFISVSLIGCEVDQSLCRRPFNEVTILGAHNISYGHKAPTRNQEYPFDQLLKMGARFFKLPVHKAPLEILLFDKDDLNAQTNLHKLLHQNDTQHFIPVVCHGLYRSEIYNTIHDINARIDELTKIDNSSPIIHKENVLKEQIAAHGNSIEHIKVSMEDSKKNLKSCVWYKPTKKCLSLVAQLTAQQTELLKEQTIYNVLKGELALLHQGHTLADQSAHKIIDINKKIEQELRLAIGTDAKEGFLSYTACFVDPASIPLLNILHEIKLFLDRNRSAVIMVLLEETIQNLDILANHFKFFGLDSYAHVHIKGTPWVSYQEMIDTNKRLVVMIDSKAGTGGYDFKKYPWIHVWSDYWVGPSRWG